MNIPQISVVMPAYNVEHYLRESIESIRNQTFTDYEFIIINDGSTDGTKGILDSFSEIDSRIKAFHQKNKGVASALNLGCRHARGQYIAIMNADDISLPSRLEKQIRYLERHPEIGIVGTWLDVVDEYGTTTGNWYMASLPGVVKWNLSFGAALAHGTVLMRRSIIRGLKYYTKSKIYNEDYDLWFRAAGVIKLANMPEVLYKYRICGKGLTSVFKDEVFRDATTTSLNAINRLLKTPVDYVSAATLRRYIADRTVNDPRDSKTISRLLIRLFSVFRKDPSITREEMEEIERDVTDHLYYLVAVTSRMSRRASLVIFFRSVAVSPVAFTGLFLTNVMKKISREIGRQ
jgi:glycosyltransferase involved in cell wall biosynthesis